MSLTFETTHGKIKFELYCEAVPLGCKNFIALCASGFYNNTIFFGISGENQGYLFIQNGYLCHTSLIKLFLEKT